MKKFFIFFALVLFLLTFFILFRVNGLRKDNNDNVHAENKVEVYEQDSTEAELIQPEVIAVPRGKNVFLVTIDTLNANHLGYMGYPLNTTPFLDGIAKKSILFKNAYTPYPLTIPAHASIFTSLYPYDHGVIFNKGAPDKKFETIAQKFKEKGYKTAGFLGLSVLEDLNQGFDQLDYNSEYQVDLEIDVDGVVWGASKVVRQAINWIDEQDKDEKFFVWVHFYDLHLPFNFGVTYEQDVNDKIKDENVLANYFEKTGVKADYYLKPSEANMLLQASKYDGNLKRIDTELESFYNKMNEYGLNRDAIWFITSDHGESLGSHYYYGHHRRVYNEMLTTPILIHDTKNNENRVFNEVVELVDIAPTLGEMFDFEINSNYSEKGNSLMDIINGESQAKKNIFAMSCCRSRDLNNPAERKEYQEYREMFIQEMVNPKYVYDGEGYIRFSLQNDNFKLIYNYRKREGGEDLAEYELYNLKTDPLEYQSVINEYPDEKKKMEAEILKYVKKVNAVQVPTSTEDDELIEEALRALGY